MNRNILAFCLATLALAASAERQSFDRYQPILDRQMFGPLPPDFDPTKLPSEVQRSKGASDKELTQEQEKLKSAIHFSVIDVRGEDVLVGFTDNSDPKVPRNYFLKVGETRDGWTVKEADKEEASMTIEKDGIEISLTLGGNSATGAGKTSRVGAAAGASVPNRPPLAGGSLLARRELRRQQKKAAEEKAAADSAAREAEHQAQLEAQRVQQEAEKAKREQERAEQRQQLLQIQEELRRVRESKATEGGKGDAPEENQNQ